MQPFRVRIEDAQLANLDRRLRDTRWIETAQPDGESPRCGADFARQMVEFWRETFDWRALEARINRQPQVMVEIDALQIHTIHRQSSREDAIPLILIHGWPTSILEFLDVCDALAEPAGDTTAFHLVIPSLPGHGFSQTRPGISPRKIAGLFTQLMTQLGYEQFLVQGGNWGSSIGTEMAREWPERVIGLHLNAVNAGPPDDAPLLSGRDKAIAETYATLLSYPHFNLLTQAPSAIAHALNDSPAGTLGWLADKLYDWADTDLPGNPALSPDWIVGTAALYWLTGTAASAAALYREAVLDPAPRRYVEVPTGVAHFAAEMVMVPRPWAERDYNIVRWTEIASGGHYPAYEVPQLFVEDVRGFSRNLCHLRNPG